MKCYKGFPSRLKGGGGGRWATRQDFDDTVTIHPTASEELFMMQSKGTR